MRVLILTILVAWPLLCRAETQEPLLPLAKMAFEQYVPTSRFDDYETAFGDINGDRLTDFITFIDAPHVNDNGVKNLKAVVFLGTKDKTFRFYEISSEILRHERVAQALEIKKQSIYLHRDGSGGCCSHWVEEFQFKMRDGHLMLIGLEEADYHPDGITDPDTGISANFISGHAIKWTTKGKSKKEKRIAVPTLKPVPFKDFDYDSFSEKWSAILW